MGVGAIFISTLAKYRLPEPASPPETPQDILATALHPVVGFVVLVSIIVRKSVSLLYWHPLYECILRRWIVNCLLHRQQTRAQANSTVHKRFPGTYQGW